MKTLGVLAFLALSALVALLAMIVSIPASAGEALRRNRMRVLVLSAALS